MLQYIVEQLHSLTLFITHYPQLAEISAVRPFPAYQPDHFR